MDDEDPHDVNMELKRNGALDIYDDAFVIAYFVRKRSSNWINTQGKKLCCA